MRGALALLAALALVGAAPTRAVAVEPAASGPRGAGELAAEKARREDALRALEERLRSSAESRGRLEREIAGLSSDRAALAAALVAAAARGRATEERIAAAEARLDALAGEERDLRRSLDGRRASLAAALAALQRMGRHPPPALLAHPEDVLGAVRAGRLLGALAPALRDEARALGLDLAKLSDLRRSVAADRAALDAELASLAAERERLGALVRLRQERVAAVDRDARGEKARGEALGAEARTLKGLIDGLESEAAAAERAAEEEARALRERIAAASLRDPARLSPRQSLATGRGGLARPAVGRALRAFGDPDGAGGTLRGVAFATRPRATVTSSTDGWIVFAGPFRSYGRLLIINGGGGYHLVLAGMAEIDVGVGQFVLAGEPVGRMGEEASPAAALGAPDADGPVLYVEIRKDGGPVDPGPWWVKQGERARG